MSPPRQKHLEQSDPQHGAQLIALPASFYARDPRRVAPELLGKLLLRKYHGQKLVGRIVEVEAYLGSGDAAAHSARGITRRNEVLFGPPGRAYVYFIYGNHYCLNVSCEREGKAGCLLIRALEPLAGHNAMARARGISEEIARRNPRLLTSGPGRLCAALSITRERDNGQDLSARESKLWIADDGFRQYSVRHTPRIGIQKASDWPLRYLIPESAFVSG